MYNRRKHFSDSWNKCNSRSNSLFKRRNSRK